MCELGSAGVGILQERLHRPTVHSLHFHTLLMTLLQTTAKHGPTQTENTSVIKTSGALTMELHNMGSILPEVLTGRSEYGSVAREVMSLNAQHHISQLSVHS